jgi:outer membrane biosynthesis protein TonB
MWFFGKKRAKKKALQEEQLKMQQESKKKSAFVGDKPAPSKVEVKKEEAVIKQEKKDETVKVQPKEAPKKDETVKVQPKETPKKEAVVKAKEAPIEEKKNKKYHVSQNKDAKSDYYKQWRVRKEGSSKTIKYFDTQAEAIDYAQDLADKNDSSIVIHKLDGSIRKQEYK